MTEPNIPHFQPLTVSGQFPESDVRGAAAREAASGRVTYLDWVSFRDKSRDLF